jgi:class 3 adenylate cyclase/tetratricopeptide (TPR) repeat protein
MKCPRCQQETPLDADFCPECGARLVVVCVACGTANVPTHKFCKKCGQGLGDDAGHGQVRLNAAAPSAYTPKHLAEKILTSKSAIEGERKQVTILFCDIVESTRLAERLDPERMHELMDRALRLMAEAVHRYEGTVNQFLGDGLMALFGAPVAVEDHALRAAQAALAIRETLAGYSEQLKQERGVELQLRVGLNTGLVVVGRIGDDLRMDYTAVGDATNLAARVMALAEPGTILVTEATHRLIEGYVRGEPLGLTPIRGRGEPVAIFRITGRRRARRRFDVVAERGLTPLAGRDGELQLLHDCLTRAKAGRGQVVSIMGDAGVGKSRLIHEFHQSLGGERVTWLEGHCMPYGQIAPYFPVLDGLRASFGIEEGDNQLQIEEKLRQGVRQIADAGLEWTLPLLGELLTSREEPALRHLEPKEKRKKTFEAMYALTAAAAQRRLLIMVQEDLHWIDKTSEDYLAFVVDKLAGLRALLITTNRPGYAIRWADKSCHTQIPLTLLDEREVETMMKGLLGIGGLPSDLLRLVQERADGNPLFVEEITTSLQERGVLVRTEHGVSWAQSGPIEFPSTVQDIIRARLDRLEDPVKRTAQTAAVIGREFGLGLLTRISELSAEVQGYLERLTHLELIHEKRLSPEIEYVFKHAVIQDVAYQSLLLQRRKDLHTAIGAAIEELYADRLNDQAAILSYHYARSHRPDRAAGYALVAGDRAAKLYANAEATTHYEEALRILSSLPASPQRDELQVDATIKLASVATTRLHFERDLTNLDAALPVARRLDNQRRTAQVLYWIARTHYVRGNLTAAVQFAEQSLAVGDTLPEDDVVVWPINLIGRIYTVLGDYAKATSMLQRCVPLFERLGNLNELATASGFLGVALATTGQFQEALKFGDQGLRIAQEIQNLPAEAADYYYRAWIYEQRGEWPRVVDDCRAGLEVAERIPDPFRICAVTCMLGQGLFRLGEEQRGLESLQRGIRLAEELGTTYLLAWALTWLCDAHLARRDGEAAFACASRALSLVGTGTELYGESLASRCYGEALGQSDPARLEEAEAHMRRAIAIQEQNGMKPQLARSYVACARFLNAKGEIDEARECLHKARDLFRTLEMEWDQQRLAEAFREV